MYLIMNSCEDWNLQDEVTQKVEVQIEYKDDKVQINVKLKQISYL